MRLFLHSTIPVWHVCLSPTVPNLLQGHLFTTSALHRCNSIFAIHCTESPPTHLGGVCGVGGRCGGRCGVCVRDLDLDFGADLKAHTTPGGARWRPRRLCISAGHVMHSQVLDGLFPPVFLSGVSPRWRGPMSRESHGLYPELTGPAVLDGGHPCALFRTKARPGPWSRRTPCSAFGCAHGVCVCVCVCVWLGG